MNVIDASRATHRRLIDHEGLEKLAKVHGRDAKNAAVTAAPVTDAEGVGPKIGKELQKLGIRTLGDLANTKVAFPLEASFSPRQAAMLVGLQAGLHASMKPGAPLEAAPEAPNPWKGLWEQQELGRAPRNREGRIVVSETDYSAGCAQGYSVPMSDAEYLQYRKEAVEYEVYQHEMRLHT